MLDELLRGFERLSDLFHAQFVEVLVPPWNRIAQAVVEERRGVGLTGLSTFGPSPRADPHWVNVHLDIFEWHPRRPRASSDVYRTLAAEVERRLAGDDEPIGIMTHHLVHEEGSWALLEDLLSTTARHPGTTWPEVRNLFAIG